MRIAILHASAGEGHKKAAEAVREGFLSCGIPPEEILLLDALDETPGWFRSLYISTYYYSVRHTPWAWGAVYKLFDHPFIYRTLGRLLREWGNTFVAKKLVERMQKEKPEAFVFTHFFAPEVIGRAKEEGKLSGLTVSVVTDFLPHAFWVNPGTDYYWVTSEEGKHVLEGWGVPSERITPGGIPVFPKFQPQGKRNEFRKKEGLLENRFTILITSGSFGLGPTAEILDALKEFGQTIQVLVVCGRNETLRRSLEAKGYPFRVKLYGFVTHMDELMEASDLIVAKPGGATTSESLAKEIPMVVLEPIPGQEAGNARLLRQRNAAFLLGKPADIKVILKGILDYPEVLGEKKRSIQALAKPEAAVEVARFVLEKIGSSSKVKE